jgi:hypothetical protein
MYIAEVHVRVRVSAQSRGGLVGHCARRDGAVSILSLSRSSSSHHPRWQPLFERIPPGIAAPPQIKGAIALGIIATGILGSFSSPGVDSSDR